MSLIPPIATAALVVGTGLAAVFGIGLAAVAWWRSEGTPAARSFAVVMGACGMWAATNALQLYAAGTGRAGLATALHGVGVATLSFIPLTWFVFAAEYDNRSSLLRRRVILPLAFVSALFSVGNLTSFAHGLMWSGTRIVETGGFRLLVVTREPGFWAAVTFSYAVISAGSLVFLNLLFRSAHISRRQVGTILLAGLPPIVASIAHVARLSPVPGLDLSPVAFVVEGVVVYWALSRYEFLNLSPVARDAVVSDLQDGVVVVDDDGTVTDSNAAATELSSVEDPVGRDVEVAFPSIGSVVETVGDPVTDGGETVSRGVAVADAEDVYVDVNQTPISNHRETSVGSALVLHDVTRRERREGRLTALQQAGRKMSKETTPADVRRSAIEAGQKITGVPFVSIYSLEGDRLVPEVTSEGVERLTDDAPPTFEVGEGLVGTAFERGEVVAYDDLQSRVTTPDPTHPELPIRSAVIAPLGEDGVLMAGDTDPIEDRDTVRFFELLSNATHAAMKRAEREEDLRDRERTLQRKNERLDEFASVVSHDLRNPLSVASSYLELARETGERDHFEEVAESLDRMDELTDELLTLARQGESVEETSPVSLESVVDDAWRNVSTGSADIDVEEGVVTADRKRLQQVLENLVSNALTHGDAGLVAVGATEEGFFVADDGSGIPPDERDRVFDRGYTGGNGTGFGLAIVSDVARAHGWTVAVDESQWGGARFDFEGVHRGD
jgi:signal transduction histidine kinase